MNKNQQRIVTSLIFEMIKLIRYFWHNCEVMVAVIIDIDEKFADLPENPYKDAIHKLEEFWNKCIELS